MDVDWDLILKVAMPIVTLFAGAALNRYIEGREKLISHLGHIASFRVQPEDPSEPETRVHTHSVIVRNAGRKPAKNVRLGHNFLPNINVFPDIYYFVRELPAGSREIVFPTIPPKKEVIISYLYFPPETWDRVNTHVESDSGPAKVLNVLLQKQMSRWVVATIWFFTLFGLVSFAYLIAGLISDSAI